MNKTFQEFEQFDANEMEIFFLKASYYFYDNADVMPSIPARQIARCMSEAYTLMKNREGN